MFLNSWFFLILVLFIFDFLQKNQIISKMEISLFYKNRSFFLVKTVKKMYIFDQQQAKMTFQILYRFLDFNEGTYFKNRFAGSIFTFKYFGWLFFVRGGLYFLNRSKLEKVFWSRKKIIFSKRKSEPPYFLTFFQNFLFVI